ncbi:MAG: metallophosphoesterase [Bryobacterales bacterium]|nr:metallophosphoesterase [Bryobacteraceae bacterium]MDW8129347.1 metallophosphoesterase [Bryobacterales bacterium]
MDRFWSWLPEILAALAGFVALRRLAAAIGRTADARARPALWALAAWIAVGLILTLSRAAHRWPGWAWLEWIRGTAPLAAGGVLFAHGLFALWRRSAACDPRRRSFLRIVAGAVASGPPAAVAFGILVERLGARRLVVEMPVPELPEDLEGLRIVQLTDIHLGPFLGARELAWAVAMANEFRPHLAVVTGDLISAGNGSLQACLAELARLRAEAGVLGCHGNHEIYAGAEALATRLGSRWGLCFLRQQSRLLRFGRAALNVAGVDYQRRGRPYLRDAAELVHPGAVNLLLSHNPDVFPVAARLGFQLVLAGHTHGGQVNVEILGEHLNIARFWTPFVYGLYVNQRALLFVSRGLGTVGIPLRLGAPPEIVCLRLRRAANTAAKRESDDRCAIWS